MKEHKEPVIKNELTSPFYIRISFFFIGLISLTAVLYIAQDIIVPIIFSVIIAVLLQPVVDFFVHWKINRVLAIIVTLSLTFLIILALCILLFSQLSHFSESWPTLVQKFTELIDHVIIWASDYFDIKAKYIHEWVSKSIKGLLDTGSLEIGHTILSVGSGIMVLLLLPVYTFLILYYQPLLLEFIQKLFKKEIHKDVDSIVTQIKTVVQRYLTGLLIEVVIVSVLSIAVLLILGIDYAILLGIIGGLLNMIPYIGGIIGVALPMMVALVTKPTGWYPLYILILYYAIQLIDNNYIVPKIVASKVKINALFSIVVVLAGNAMWGISGMFLSIPLLAIAKLIFDHIDSLKPWGFLLGDTMPPVIELKAVVMKFKKKKL
jgi:predicted PurR-regulated permease PerM